MTTDYFQNSIDHARTVGRYEYPIIVILQRINPDNIQHGTGEAIMPPAISSQVQSTEVKHD